MSRHQTNPTLMPTPIQTMMTELGHLAATAVMKDIIIPTRILTDPMAVLVVRKEIPDPVEAGWFMR